MLPPERIDPLTTTDPRPAPPSEATPAPDAPTRGDRARRILRGFGIACLVLAAGIAGFVWWTLWGTGIATAKAQTGLGHDLRKQVQVAQGNPALGDRPILQGKVYAEIRIPTIGADYYVVQGTTVPDLEKGPGHYPQTADPWDRTGRVGIAGHRTTYLHPFQNLAEVKTGDPIVLVTAHGTFNYRVTRVFIVPEVGSGKVLTQTKDPTLVLTTCNPEYSSYQRLIVTADRVGKSVP